MISLCDLPAVPHGINLVFQPLPPSSQVCAPGTPVSVRLWVTWHTGPQTRTKGQHTESSTHVWLQPRLADCACPYPLKGTGEEMAALSHCPLIPCLFWNRSPSAVPHSCHITHLSLSRSFPWICKHSEPHLCCRPAHMHNTHTHTPALTSFQPDFSTSLPTCWSYFLHILLAMW